MPTEIRAAALKQRDARSAIWLSPVRGIVELMGVESAFFSHWAYRVVSWSAFFLGSKA